MIGERMERQIVELNHPTFESLGVRAYSMPVHTFELREVPLANADEVATFATQKRNDEHMSGRWLLGHALKSWGIEDLSVLHILRNQERAPRVAYLQGMWLNLPLPSISISHSGGHVFVALADSSMDVGIDAEPSSRSLAANAFDMMSTGDELEQLRQQPNASMFLWTAKEAVQKAMRKGMHLNPRKIKVSIGQNNQNISIENSKIQLVSWTESDFQLGLAVCLKSEHLVTAEDRLLEATRSAMESDPDWGVGCKTNRGNV